MRNCLHFKSSDCKQYMKYFNGTPFLHLLSPFLHSWRAAAPHSKSQLPISPMCFSLPSPVLSETRVARSPPWEALRHGDEGYCLGPEYQGREQMLRCPEAGWNLGTEKSTPLLLCFVLGLPSQNIKAHTRRFLHTRHLAQSRHSTIVLTEALPQTALECQRLTHQCGPNCLPATAWFLDN